MTVAVRETFEIAADHVRADPIMFVVAMVAATLPIVLADVFLSETASIQIAAALGLLLLFFQILIANRCLRRTNAVDHHDVPQPTFYPRAFGQGLVGGLGILFGFILFILPGIILYTRWFVSLPVLVSRNTGAIDSLHESWRMTKGDESPIFLVTALAFVPSIIGIALVVFADTLLTNIAFEFLTSLTIVGLWYLQIAVFQVLRGQQESVRES